MRIAPAVAGATLPVQRITWLDADDLPVDLTGGILTGRVRLSTGPSRDITGSLVLTDADSGVFTWNYSAADVALAGTHEVQFTATFSSQPMRTVIVRWTVHESIP